MKPVSPRASHPAVQAVKIGLGCVLAIGMWSCTKADPYQPPDLFYYYASYKVGKNPTTITTGDFNHDTFTDLITTNISSNTLSILLGNGDGSFSDQTQIKVCLEPRTLVMADFNHDTHADIVLACSGGDEIAFLMGRGNGKFEEGPHYPVHRTPVALATE
ncbi:MAG: VCBS repeat-containing protein, partial [Nitrospirota bacterium]